MSFVEAGMGMKGQIVCIEQYKKYKNILKIDQELQKL